MANKLPNEKELLEQLSREKVAVPSDMWNIIYSSIEDGILIIKLIVSLYQEQNKDIPVDEAKKILTNIQDISAVFRKLLNPQIIKTEDKGFMKIKSESKQLNPIIRDMVTHYIGNDIQALNFMIGDTIDDGIGLGQEMCEKIMRHITDMEEFLVKLKLNTETTEEKIRNRLTLPLVYLRSLRESMDDSGKEKIDKCLDSLKEINGILEKKK
ncbi:MAG: hypothetical protein KAJ14_01805 [Candidatus Omnitrophica bacterium]|nr:hypothetical protein [Candidatus Omnitrophota bacterium]